MMMSSDPLVNIIIIIRWLMNNIIIVLWQLEQSI